jgi:tRNA threonylcarbamoyladenosine biosynthesis protein TsaB
MPGEAAPAADLNARLILAFDTAGSACSAAVGRDADVIAYERREMRHGHAEALLPMIDRVMAAAGVAAVDLAVIAVSLGPGGFTGIRAGLAAAQGISLAADARLVGVSSFAAVAALFGTANAPLLVALDSRREDLYVQLFHPSGSARSEPAAVLPQELPAFVDAAIGNTPLRIAGDAAENAAAALARRAGLTVLADTTPDARGVLAAARAVPKAEQAPPRPLYLRPPDVTFPKPRGAIVSPS